LAGYVFDLLHSLIFPFALLAYKEHTLSHTHKVDQHAIVEYAVKQCTLEQLFLQFAREQIDDEA
jgi:hypothetical protein